MDIWVLCIYMYLLPFLVVDNIVFGSVSSVNKSCNEECQVAPHINCSVIQDALCHSDTYNSSNGDWPGAPANLDVTLITTEVDPVISVSWGIPGDASFSYVTGFLLEITQLSTNESNCVHVDLSGTSWDTPDLAQRLTFHFTCFSGLTLGDTYHLRIQSLPLPHPEYVSDRDLYVAFTKAGAGTAAAWLSVIKFYVLSSHKFSGIRVYFTAAPPHLGFTGYEVAVSDNTGYILQKKPIYVAWEDTEEKYELQVNFENICAGKHKLVITPHHTSWYNGSCTCGGSPPYCGPCPDAVTSLFSVTSGIPCEKHTSSTISSSSFVQSSRHADPGLVKNPTTSSPIGGGNIDSTTHSTVIVTTVIVASVLLLGVVIALGVYIYKRAPTKQHRDTSTQDQRLSDFGGPEDIWADFIRPPLSSDKFKDRASCHIQEINDAQSQMFEDSGFNETHSFEQSGKV